MRKNEADDAILTEYLQKVEVLRPRAFQEAKEYYERAWRDVMNLSKTVMLKSKN